MLENPLPSLLIFSRHNRPWPKCIKGSPFEFLQSQSDLSSNVNQVIEYMGELDEHFEIG